MFFVEMYFAGRRGGDVRVRLNLLAADVPVAPDPQQIRRFDPEARLLECFSYRRARRVLAGLQGTARLLPPAHAARLLEHKDLSVSHKEDMGSSGELHERTPGYRARFAAGFFALAVFCDRAAADLAAARFRSGATLIAAVFAVPRGFFIHAIGSSP